MIESCQLYQLLLRYPWQRGADARTLLPASAGFVRALRSLPSLIFVCKDLNCTLEFRLWALKVIENSPVSTVESTVVFLCSSDYNKGTRNNVYTKAKRFQHQISLLAYKAPSLNYLDHFLFVRSVRSDRSVLKWNVRVLRTGSGQNG